MFVGHMSQQVADQQEELVVEFAEKAPIRARLLLLLFWGSSAVSRWHPSDSPSCRPTFDVFDDEALGKKGG